MQMSTSTLLNNTFIRAGTLNILFDGLKRLSGKPNKFDKKNKPAKVSVSAAFCTLAKVKLPLGLRFIWRDGRSLRWEEQTQIRGVSRC
jgi:hypothetical protein